ncbi:MAG: NADP-dependent oxidoreductase [bacterium]|nr:NADP-dependent oxidoreductase [bacterium]
MNEMIRALLDFTRLRNRCRYRACTIGSVKAFALERYGRPERVTCREFPEPSCGPGDLLVEMKAASINPVDIKIRQGAMKVLIKDRFPLTLGCDVSGVVVKTGKDVTRFAEGDEIFARLRKERIGSLAERVLVHEDVAAHKPKRLTHAEAASLPLVGLTSLQAMVGIGGLTRGQRVLVHAGSGGVGTFAIQLAKHLGATVATTASGKNHALVEKLGAVESVDYRTERFEDVVAPCDVVFDTQGGETLERSFKVVKRGGVVVTIGGKPDGKFAKAWGLNPVLVLALGFMMRKVTRLAQQTGSRFEYLFMRPDGAELSQIGALVESGAIVPVIDSTFPFADALAAMARVEAGRAVGKVVVVRE